jgi:hypothetical protein
LSKSSTNPDNYTKLITLSSSSPLSAGVSNPESSYFKLDFVYKITVSSLVPSSVHPRGFVHPLNFFPLAMSASLYTTA